MKINFGKIPPESVALQYFIFKNNSFYYESNLDFNILRNRKIFHAYGELKMAPQQTHLDTITFQDSIPGIYTDTISVIFYTGKIVYMPVYGEIVAINDIGEITPNNDISLEIIPSPTYSKSTLKFKLINAGFIDCDLVDINGNTIQNIFSYKYFEAGANEYFLDFGSITNGVYFLRVKIDGKYYSKKVNILR